MRTLRVMALLLLSANLLCGQANPANPRGVEQNTPGSRQGAANFSESTIQGCVLGSATTGQYILTDQNNGQVYVLQGNDPMLKEQVGHEVLMTGTATPMPNRTGVGAQSPSTPTTGGATKLAGKPGLNFDVTHIQRIADTCSQDTAGQRDAIAASQAALGGVGSENRGATEPRIGYAAQNQSREEMIGCVSGSRNDLLLNQQQQRRTYRLKGNTGQLPSDLGKLVKVTGHMVPGTGPAVSGAQEQAPIFQVSGVQVLESSCTYQSPPGVGPLPATGKTGNSGEAFNVTTTESAGRVTPGNETQAGRAQEPGEQTGLTAGGVPQAQNRTAAQGAPNTAEQTAQNPDDAMKYRNAATESELSNPQQQLGVNAQPSNVGVQQQAQRESSQQTNRAAQEGQTYGTNRNTRNGTELPGASQQLNMPEHARTKREGQAAEHHQTEATLVGCLTGSGHDFFLREQTTGTQYRLNATREDVKDHVNHLVELSGKPGNRTGAENSVAEKNQPVFDVTGVQDLAPTCGAPR